MRFLEGYKVSVKSPRGGRELTGTALDRTNELYKAIKLSRIM